MGELMSDDTGQDDGNQAEAFVDPSPGKPVAERTAEEQTSYWKARARHVENVAGSVKEAKQRNAELERLTQENARLREASQTEQERAIEMAREEARKEALAEAALQYIPQMVHKDARRILEGRLSGEENAEETLNGLLDLLPPARYIKPDNTVDIEKLTHDANVLRPQRAPGTSDTNPTNGFRADLGQGRRGGPGGGGTDAKTAAEAMVERMTKPSSNAYPL